MQAALERAGDAGSHTGESKTIRDANDATGNVLDRSRKQTTPAIPATTAITIFTIPKPFDGHTEIIQRNAIKSWRRLEPEVAVVLVGDEVGVAETAAELEVHHVPEIERNELGTPLVSSAFAAARQISQSPVLCFCNCDVMLTKGFVRAIEIIQEDPRMAQFVAIGRRTEIDIKRELDVDNTYAFEKLLADVKTSGRRAALVCKEYFAFTRDQYIEMPEFAVGRGNWDNWMVASAKRRGVPVVNVSSRVTAIHQNHDYHHTGSGRMSCYITGPEARRNQELAGGRNLISGATASWKLKPHGVSPIRFASAGLDFWRDLPRFAGLLWNLAFSSR